MKKVIDFLKQNGPRILLAGWCVWTTIKLNRIEQRMAEESSLYRLDSKLEEFRDETRRAREQEAIARIFRH